MLSEVSFDFSFVAYIAKEKSSIFPVSDKVSLTVTKGWVKTL